MLSLKGIKARPHDLEAMLVHRPTLVELHCSVKDLAWEPAAKHLDVALAVHLPEYDAGRLIDPAALHDGRRGEAVRLFSQALGRARAWGPYFNEDQPVKVVFHPGGMDVEDLSPALIAQKYAALDLSVAALAAAARSQGVELLIENLPGHCWFFGGNWLAGLVTSGAQLRAVAERHGIGATLDLCHLYLAAQSHKYDLLAEIRAALPVVRHLHYSDASGVDGEGLQIGEGEAPLREMLAAVAGLDAVAVPEIWFGHEKGGAKFAQAWDLAGKLLPVADAVAGRE